jgi:Excreted virulence factor EspC, type VII ESX diderm
MTPGFAKLWKAALWKFRLWTGQLSLGVRRPRIRGVSRISVEPLTLRTAAARVDDVSTALDRASRQLSRIGSDALGHPRLTRAVDDFVTSWEYAVDRISSAADAAAERLRAAAEIYDDTEDAVRAAAGGAQ